ncbi:hypothetical protein LCGC14_2406930, partial [marine sediment metagenome]
LIMLLAISVVCLSLVVHPQWSKREHLRYPVATFAAALMGATDDEDGRPVFTRRLFWIGLGVILAIHIVNGMTTWGIWRFRIPLRFSFWPIAQTWPEVARVPRINQLLSVAIYPTAVAIGFMLSSQVSFSLGIGPPVLAVISGVLLSVGVDMSSDHVTGGLINYQLFGSYLALALLGIYTGRKYYGHVLAHAVTFRRRSDSNATAAWACRIGLLATAATVALLISLGLDWPLAVAMVGMTLMMFLVMARINAESGLFYCQPFWQPVTIFLGLFGLSALGPKMVAILAMLGAVLTIDPRECLMPFVVNALKMCESVKVRPSRVGVVSVVAVGVALAVALPVGLWANYNYGIFGRDRWAAEVVPEKTYGIVEKTVATMTEDQLAASVEMGSWERIKAMRPNRLLIRAAGVGFLLVLVGSALRLRYARFPLHPVLFLVWGTGPIGHFSHSFLLGWLIKSVVTRYGGGQAIYRRATWLMFGVIAGDLLGGLIWMAAGAVYSTVTGYDPPVYRTFPG